MKIFKQVTANNIELKPYPFKKELAMEAYLIENEEILSLDNDNFNEVVVLDEEIYNNWGHKRHYIKPAETINLSDGEIIATCTQWNPRNIAEFIKVANKLDFQIKLK